MPPISPGQTSLRAAFERDWYIDSAIEFAAALLIIAAAVFIIRKCMQVIG